MKKRHHVSNGNVKVIALPCKPLPALIDGNIELLPSAVLPLPLGGTSENPGKNGEDEWADLAIQLLIPRWAVECIKADLVTGQALREGESLKERTETILRTQGEMDKWRRIVGWGINVVRHLDVASAEKWNGSLRELLELGDPKNVSILIRLAFSARWNDFLGVKYWYDWATAGWYLVEEWLRRRALGDADREKAARLVIEAKSYWAHCPIPNKTPLADLLFNQDKWRGDDVGQMCHCLSMLQSQPPEPTWDKTETWMIFGGNWAYYRAVAKGEYEKRIDDIHVKTLFAQMEAQVAEANAREQEAQADKFNALGMAEAEAEARNRAEGEWKRLEEERRKETEARAQAEALAEERGRLLSMKLVTKEDVGAVGAKVDEVKEEAIRARVAAGDKGEREERDGRLVGVFVKFFEELGPGVDPQGKIVFAHFQDFIVGGENRLALGRCQSWRTFRVRYAEWIGMGRPTSGKEYRAKLEEQKQAERKAKRAGVRSTS